MQPDETTILQVINELLQAKTAARGHDATLIAVRQEVGDVIKANTLLHAEETKVWGDASALMHETVCAGIWRCALEVPSNS